MRGTDPYDDLSAGQLYKYADQHKTKRRCSKVLPKRELRIDIAKHHSETDLTPDQSGIGILVQVRSDLGIVN